MSWLDKLDVTPTGGGGKKKKRPPSDYITSAIAASLPAPQQPSLVPMPPSAPVVNSCYAAVRNPTGPNDVGQMIEVFWIVDGGTLHLTNAQGQPNGPSVAIDKTENARAVACRIAKRRWESQRNPFDRPLHYERDGSVV